MSKRERYLVSVTTTIVQYRYVIAKDGDEAMTKAAEGKGTEPDRPQGMERHVYRAGGRTALLNAPEFD